jgi:hypothetical protein
MIVNGEFVKALEGTDLFKLLSKHCLKILKRTVMRVSIVCFQDEIQYRDLQNKNGAMQSVPQGHGSDF